MRSPPLANPLERLIGYRIRRVSAGLMTELAQDLEALDLRPTEASILVLIAANPRVTPSEIGRCLGIQRANMTPLAAALERRGLLARERVNGRSHGLVLTPQGVVVEGRARAAMDGHDARLLDRMPEPARQALSIALAAVQGAGGPQ